MKRQCDSQSGDHDPTPAAKLANIAASTATTSPSNDNALMDHLHSFALLPTHTNTMDASNANAFDTGAKEGATPTPPDDTNIDVDVESYFDFGVNIEELLANDYPLLTTNSPLFKSATRAAPISTEFTAEPSVSEGNCGCYLLL